MKTKKMYQVGTYSTGDLTMEQLKDIFSKAGDFNKAVEVLINMAIDRDAYPGLAPAEDTEAEAEGHMNSCISISENTWAVHTWNVTFAGIMESFTVFDDGEFFEGADYNWNYTNDQLEELRELYNDIV